MSYNLPIYDLGHTAYHHVGASESQGITLDRVVDAIKPGIILGAAFHGYRRTQSVGWALVWVLAARIAPVVTTGVAIAQGVGKRKEC